MTSLVKKHGRQCKVVEKLVEHGRQSAMLHQIFSDFIN